MKKIEIEEVKKLLLEVLIEFHEFCEDHGLRYVLAAGTLLGAIRHNGFIPWDDDIDLYMPRPDYERLLEIYPKEGKNDLYEHKLNAKYMYPFAKLGKPGTLCVEKGGYSGIEIGVYVDIFPIDGLGNEIDVAKRQVKKVTRLVNMELSLLVEQWRRNVSFTKNFMIWTLHVFSKIYGGHKKILKKMKKALLAFGYDDSDYVGQIVEMPGNKKITRRELFENRTLHVFEGKMFYVPKEYDKILTGLYGDYMQLPPEEKRVYAHGYEAYYIEKEDEK